MFHGRYGSREGLPGTLKMVANGAMVKLRCGAHPVAWPDPGPGLGVSYEHGRFPKRVWHIQQKNTGQILNNLISALYVWLTNGISLRNFFSHAKNSGNLFSSMRYVEDLYEFNAV